MAKMVDKAVDEVLRKSFSRAQSGVRSVVYNVVGQVMLNLLCKNVIEETLDAHVTNNMITYEVAKGLSERLLTLCSFMVPIVTLVRRKPDLAKKIDKMSPTYASKELMSTVKQYNDESESSPRLRESERETSPRRKWSKRRLKLYHNKRKRKNLNPALVLIEVVKREGGLSFGVRVTRRRRFDAQAT